jgi:hypothetical protein
LDTDRVWLLRGDAQRSATGCSPNRGRVTTTLSIALLHAFDGATQALIDRLNAELSARYPEEGANHFRLDPEEIAPGRGGACWRWRARAPGPSAAAPFG